MQAGCMQIYGSNNRTLGFFPDPQTTRKPLPGATSSKWTNLRSILKRHAKEYCDHSTIHGMSYIGSRKSFLERLWWIAMFVLSVYGSARLIDNVYQKWTNHPVIMSFEEKPIPVWVFPFPAVTICPQVKFESGNMNFTEDFYRLANYGGAWAPLSLERRRRLLAVLQVCDKFFHVNPKFQKLYGQNLSNLDTVDLLRNLSIKAKHTLLTCHVNGIRCKDMFTETLTDEGICFTFNGFSSHDMFRDGVLHNDYKYLNGVRNLTNWNLDTGFSPGKTDDSYPIRARGSGVETGLSMRLMVTNADVDQHCREQQGFKVILHAPKEYPQVKKKFILVSYSQDVSLAVRPIIYMTSRELSGYHPKRRHCYFNHERPLQFFRVYSQSNCELECLTNFTLHLCGCVRFSMPRTNDTRVCHISEIACVIQAEKKMLIKAATNRLKKLESLELACDCIPGCSSIAYDAEITQTKCDFKKTLALRHGQENPTFGKLIDLTQISKLAIYFKDTQFITLRRSELFGVTDFIANCGGILGLCLGVSLFSLVELLYYCLVRPVLLLRNSIKSKNNVTVVKGIDEGRY